MNSAASSARFRSASSNTTNGLLPPSSMLNFFSPAACTMRLPVAVLPVNEIARTSGCAHSGSPAPLPVPCTTLSTPFGHAGLEHQLAEPRGRHRRQLAHLQHRGVAEGEARRGLPGGRHERHVPRADQRAHADRVEQRVVEVRRRRIGVAVDARAHLGEVVEVVGRARHQLLAGLRDHLAGVLGLGARQLGHVLGDQVADLAHQRGAFGGRPRGPGGKRGLRGGDRGVDLVGAAVGHLGQHLLRRRIDGLERGLAVDRSAVDQVLDAHAAVSIRSRFSGRTPRRRRWCSPAGRCPRSR